MAWTICEPRPFPPIPGHRPSPGTRLGAYEVIAKLSEGGMGEVYRARDTKLDRDVAIKILPDSSSPAGGP